MNTWSETKPLDAGIILGGFALALALVCLTTEAGPPYPHELWFLDRVGGVLIYGMSIGFLGILASQKGLQGRREPLGTGEWLGVVTAALLLSTAWLMTPIASGLGEQVFVWLFAHCLIQCLLSMMSAGFLFAKLFTRHRPGPRVEPPRTNILGYLVCAVTGPFIYWQFAAIMVGIGS
jgi:hypothetical protein